MVGALAIGTYARFKGLGAWPFGVDEYYTGQSVQNILRAGVPEYPCGGFYTRGILVQYLAAALQMAGFSPELALRSIAAVSSLIALPAAFLLGRRAGGRVVGLLAVIVLALSVWEVEMARFARMYAPFQAVFLWYLVYFVRYTIERDTRALWMMLGLSLLGVLVWEGGVLLAAANLLPPLLNSPSGRLGRREWGYLAAAGAMVFPIYLFATNKMRVLGDLSPFPSNFIDPPPEKTVVGLQVGDAPWSLIGGHPLWWALALVPVLCSAFALRWIWSLRQRWLAAAGLVIAMAAAAAQQLGLCLAVILLLLLLRLIGWRELCSRAALPFAASIAASTVFWILFALDTPQWQLEPGQSVLETAALLGYEFFRFPDFAIQVALPWARAVPLLALALFCLLAATCIRLVLRAEAQLSEERVFAVLLVSLLLAASASDPPRIETRYVFFLYPLAVLTALLALARFSAFVAERARIRHPVALLSVLALGGFALTEDFDLHHLRDVDSEAVHFRTQMKPFLANHYYQRANVRAAADWLESNAREGDIVINSFPSLDFYYPKVDYFFIDWSDRRFPGLTCRRGTIERWSNTALLYTIESFQARLRAGKRVFYVVRRPELDAMLPDLAPWRPRIIWSHQTIAIVAFDTAPAPIGNAGSQPATRDPS